jgi:hypothetical protein
MCNFTCAISKRNRVSAQNPRIQGRSCQRPAERPQSPRGRSHTFTQKGPLFHSFSLGTGSEWGRFFGALLGRAPRDRSCARREARGRIGFRAVREGRFDRFQCLLRPGPAAAGARWVNRVTGLKWANGGQAPQWGGFSVRCWVVLRGTGPARAEKLGGGWAFALCARGGLIASSACSGPVPLPLCACLVWRLGANGISRGRIRRACGRRCRFGRGGCRGCRVR